MIDFVSATKCTGKDSINLSNCRPLPVCFNGWQKYLLEGCERLAVLHNPTAGLLKIEGSLPYWLQGHNFAFSRAGYIEAVELLRQALGLPLWDAEVDAFEFGAIVPVESEPKQYIQRHFAPAGSKLKLNEKGKDAGAFRWWEDPFVSLKMYDAGKNIKMKQGLQRREVIQQAGYCPTSHYLKFETHYKPKAMPVLNNGLAVLLEDLQKPGFLAHLKQRTIEQYHQLKPMRALESPTSKKDLSSTDIITQAFVETYMKAEGKPMQAAKKELFQRINAFPDTLLTKADKDARKRQINVVFGRLKESESSPWDLTEKIEAALDAEV